MLGGGRQSIAKFRSTDTGATLPFLVLSIPAGILVDRFMRSPLMAGAEALRVVSLLCMLILALSEELTLPLLAACGTVVNSVATPALVPDLVKLEALPTANSRIELARTSALAAGPALGGAMVGWIGAAPAFGFAAGLSAIAVMLLAGLRNFREQSANANIRFVSSSKESSLYFRTDYCDRYS